MQRGPHSSDGVFCRFTFQFTLCLGRRADLERGDAAGQVRQPLAQRIRLLPRPLPVQFGLQFEDALADGTLSSSCADNREAAPCGNDAPRLSEILTPQFRELAARLLVNQRRPC